MSLHKRFGRNRAKQNGSYGTGARGRKKRALQRPEKAKRVSLIHSAESANDECVFHSRPVTGLLHQVIKSSKINVETHKTIKATDQKK